MHGMLAMLNDRARNWQPASHHGIPRASRFMSCLHRLQQCRRGPGVLDLVYARYRLLRNRILDLQTGALKHSRITPCHQAVHPRAYLLCRFSNYPAAIVRVNDPFT